MLLRTLQQNHIKQEEIMKGLGVILWGFVLMMLAFDSLVVPCIVYGIAIIVGLVIGIRKAIKENQSYGK